MKTYTIKPLEWSERRDSVWAFTPMSAYSIEKESKVGYAWKYHTARFRDEGERYATLDEAKRSAEEDWISRITVALDEV